MSARAWRRALAVFAASVLAGGSLAGEPGSGPGAQPSQRAAARRAKASPGTQRTSRNAGASDAATKSQRMANAKRMNIGSAMGFVRSGNDQMAIIAFRKQLQVDPTSVAAHVGLGKALARRGQCVEALEHLEPYEGTTPFTVESALLAALCFNRTGFLVEALHYDRLATEMGPTEARTWTSLALDLDQAGDAVGAAQAFDEIEALASEDKDSTLFARGVLALRRGDIDAFDLVRMEWEREGRMLDELRRLTAQSWLDVGDPQAALDTIMSVRKLRRGTHELVVRAEALRRLGEPDAALRALERRVGGDVDGSPADAVRARAYADQGDLAGAEALVLHYEGALEAEIVATRWYLARLRGDAAAMQEATADYARAMESPLRTLDQLVPVGS